MASNPAPSRIPTPVGGIPIEADKIPSIVFGVAYAALLPFVVRRFVVRRRRHYLLLGVCFIVADRLASFIVRAVQASQPQQRANRDMLSYLQTTFSAGYITLAVDSIILLRTIITNAKTPRNTLNPESQARLEEQKESAVHRVVRLVLLPFVILPGSFSAAQGIKFKTAPTRQSSANGVAGLRYAAASFALLLFVAMSAVVLYGYTRFPDIDRSACLRILSVLVLVIIIDVYRLAVMHNTIPSLLYTGPGALESTVDKTLFYVLHCLPELVATAMLVVPDARTTFGLGTVEEEARRKQVAKAKKLKARRSQSRNDTAAAEPQAEFVEMASYDPAVDDQRNKSFIDKLHTPTLVTP